MRRSDYEHQAAQFLAWHRKRPGAWEEDFAFWSLSKDLTPADQMRIRSLVLAELLATGEATATDMDLDLPSEAA